jgi:UDP-2,3-diacylglucosamine pyrophosphatase LpxH
MIPTIINQRFTKKRDFYHFFMSDLHIGNESFDEKLFNADLDKVKDVDGKVYIFGDVMELIFPTDRKRYTAGDDKYHSDYEINQHIEEATDLLIPYVDNIVLISSGNHETSVQKYNNFDPIRSLIERLNIKRDVKKHGYIKHGGYTGFIRTRYRQGSLTRQFDIWYHHGMSGAKRSRGILDFDIYYSQHIADAYVVGHNHTKFIDCSGSRTYLTSKSDELKVKQLYGVQLGCYNKQISHYDPNNKGNKLSYGEERMKYKQAVGGVMMKHTVSSDGIVTSFTV